MVHTVPYCPTSGFPLNLVSLDFHSRDFLGTMAIMQEKQQKTVFEIEWVIMVAYNPTQTYILICFMLCPYFCLLQHWFQYSLQSYRQEQILPEQYNLPKTEIIPKYVFKKHVLKEFDFQVAVHKVQ